MKVYLVQHDDGIDAGFSVRGVYLSHEAATASVVTLAASGRPSKAWAAHNFDCCHVEDHEVLDAPAFDVREDDPDVPQGLGVIPDGLRDAIFAHIAQVNPYRELVK